MKKKLFLLLILFCLVYSCNNKRERNIEYLPDMYESEAYETYANKKSLLKPVEGTIQRGSIPYEIPNTNEGYELSKKNINPLSKDKYSEDKTKELYFIYCAICHGENGDGQGKLVQNDKYSGVPNYKDRDINEGSVFHVITYGKGVMGSHASQLNYEERWNISKYVIKLRNK